jgi:aspartate/methionine/tyrosine aminotransferase
MQQNFFISAAAFAQRAAIAALRHTRKEVESMVRTYDRRRRLLLSGLREIGLEVPVDPQGAFCLLVETSHLDPDSHRLAFDILEKAGVALTPGVDFGRSAEGHLRFSYANSSANLKEGVRRLTEYLKEASQIEI